MEREEAKFVTELGTLTYTNADDTTFVCKMDKGNFYKLVPGLTFLQA